MEFLTAILIGIGLSAAAGFRVFTPLLIVGIAEKASLLTLANGFEWIGSAPAIIAFAVATGVEVISLYVPVLETFIKALITPAAIVAGTMLTAAFIPEMNPLMTWSLAIIAGGGTATISHVTATTLRASSTLATAGIGNIFISLIEGTTAIIMSISAIFLPALIILFLAVIIIMFVVVRSVVKKRSKQRLAA